MKGALFTAVVLVLAFEGIHNGWFAAPLFLLVAGVVALLLWLVTPRGGGG